MRETISRRSVLQGAIAGVCGAIAGCARNNGEDDDLPPLYPETDHPHTPGTPESDVNVYMRSEDGSFFDPYICHVEVGGQVTWHLTSGLHNTIALHPDTLGPQNRIPEGAEPWRSEMLIHEYEEFTHTFSKEGVYDYACSPHIGGGMLGSVIVGLPDIEGQPGLQPPTEASRELHQVDIRWEQYSAWIEYLNETVVDILSDNI